MLQGIDAGVIVHGPDQRIIFFNSKALEILGVTPEQMASRDQRDALWSRVRLDGSPIAPEDLPANRAFATRRPVRDVILGFTRRSRSDLVWVMVSANPVLTASGEVSEVIVSFVDVSARIHAEEAVRASATFTEDILNSLQAQVVVLDESGIIIAVNEAWRRFARESGAGSQSQVGKKYLAVCRQSAMRDDAAAETAEGITRLLDGTRTNFNLEYSCHAPAGRRWFRLRASRLGGGRRGVVVSHQDISEHRLAMEALRASEARFKALFEQAAVGVAQTDVSTGKYVHANRRFCEILDYRWEELRDLTSVSTGQSRRCVV